MSSCFRRCRNLWCFLAIFCTCYFLENIMFTYLITAVTSIERQFQIPSRQSGTLVSANDIGYVLTVVFLAYLGSKRNRARWIGGGCMVISMACLLGSLPGFIFSTNERVHDYNFIINALRPDLSYSGAANTEKSLDFIKGNLSESAATELKNLAILPFSTCNVRISAVRRAIQDDLCLQKSAGGNKFGYAIVFVAIAFIGVGHSMPYTLGMPLIDDNVSKDKTPFFFAGIFFIRILGPVLGFVLGGWTNKLYLTLRPPRGLSPTDPGWIGAWWLGFLFVSASLAIPSILLMCFPDISLKWRKQTDFKPKAVEYNQVREVTSKSGGRTNDITSVAPSDAMLVPEDHSFKDFCISVGKCLQSPVYIGCVIGRFFDAFAFKGFFVFQPKYLEQHYGMAQYRANYLMGFMGIIGYAIGVLSGSILMRLLKLEGRKAAAYVGAASFLSGCLSFSLVALGCDSVNNQLARQGIKNDFDFTAPCNSHCKCRDQSMFPVCDISRKIYFSPCHAGCTSLNVSTTTNDFQSNFSSCLCSPDIGQVSKALCSDDCKIMLIIYICISITTGIISGSAVIPGVMIFLRSIPPHTRSVALGFNGFIISLFSTFPSPIVFGFIIDSACLLWTSTCGGKGACTLYDSKLLRVRIHVFQAILRLSGCIFDVWVWYFAKDLQLTEEKVTGTLVEQIETVPLKRLSADGQADEDVNEPSGARLTRLRSFSTESAKTRSHSLEKRKSSIVVQALVQLGSNYDLRFMEMERKS